MPDKSGWEILEVLKTDPTTRHIPVHIISAEDETLEAYRKGGMGYLTKPVDQEGLDEAFQKIEYFMAGQMKTLLLVEDDANSRHSIKKLLGGSDGRGYRGLGTCDKPDHRSDASPRPVAQNATRDEAHTLVGRSCPA